MVPGLKDFSYPEQLRTLKLPTLVYRRLRGDMIKTYKVIRKVYDTEAAPIMPMTGSDRSIITRGNPYKMYKRRVKTRLRQHLFTERVIDVWNSLPGHVVEAPSIMTFEPRLDRVWRDQDILYDYEAALIFSSRSAHTRSNSPESPEEDLDIQVL